MSNQKDRNPLRPMLLLLWTVMLFVPLQQAHAVDVVVVCPSDFGANNQRAAAYFLSRGHHESLLRGLIKANKAKRQILLDCLAFYLPDWVIAPNQGGSSIWINGPDDLDARALAKICQKHGVLIEPGSKFYMSNDRPFNGFRLGYTAIAQSHIPQGVALIARLASQLLGRALK